MPSNEYMRLYMAERYTKRKVDCVKLLGGECIDCGSRDDLQFDHVDPSTKKFGIAKFLAGASEKRLQEELQKCVLRCYPCHLAKTKAEGSLGNNVESYRCDCGQTFVGRKAYAGHKRWCGRL